VKKWPFVLLAALILAWLAIGSAEDRTQYAVGSVGEDAFDSCTSIMVGKLASADGSTMTSHSCDSTSDRTWITVVPRLKHKPGELCPVYHNSKETKGPGDRNRLKTGEIPQVPETYAYINTAYPVMNEYQLAIGETTFGGKMELRSKDGIIDCPELYRLILERAKTAREAIHIADQAKVEEEALKLHRQNPAKAREFLTAYCVQMADDAVSAYWKLHDDLWESFTQYF